ncbi:hypothetical protein MKY15_19695 [Sporosarcina sp. FSL K6-1540]|uniref:hypothetical protein n=1 Tax=Sporosarcina sp. FSL K6-1540 TaxID=2921555 RepID=UPI00315ABCED
MNLSDSLGLAFFTIILTLLVNLVFKLLQNKFDFMVDTKKFRRDHSYNQLKELYFEIYAIIIQSEFLRNFHQIDEFKSLKEVPFIEIVRTLKKNKQDLFSREILEESEEIVVNAITKFNKIGLVGFILEKKEFASPDLLKLAVGYRYIHEHYQNESFPEKQLEKFQKKELEFIYQIVTMVVKEFNEKSKYCNMEYNKTEIKEGELDKGIFDVEKVLD